MAQLLLRGDGERQAFGVTASTTSRALTAVNARNVEVGSKLWSLDGRYADRTDDRRWRDDQVSAP
ncbi:hypothetical protein [Streptomyces sp. NPDC008137]|uniref:hypothetical protein n=1 Tax=Streptomyces sp. NPDC008137 TaxID=3364813 RepID=UPI0036E02A65